MTIQPMTAERVAKMMLNQQPLFVLDARNREDVAEWNISAPSFETANIPYFELLDGANEALYISPDDRPTLVVCAQEGSSMFVAEQLAAAGKKDVCFMCEAEWRRGANISKRFR